MACIDCFNDCEDTLTSDRCVKYTGDAITDINICTNDPLNTVVDKILVQVEAFRQGQNIVIPSLTGCNSLLSLFPTTPPTLFDVIQALVNGYCTNTSSLAGIQATLNTSFPFDIACLTGLTSTSSKDQILQAVITQVCATLTSVNSITADYVKASQLTSLIKSYIDSTSSSTIVNQYTLAIPYVAYEYYGSLTNFDSSGVGIAGKGYDKMFICNGANGTPDKRGRATVGAIAGVPGGSLDAAVDPSLPANAGNNYALKDKIGSSSISLDVTQIPGHTHPLTDLGHSHSLNPAAGRGQIHRGGDTGYAYRTEDFGTAASTSKDYTNIYIGSAGGSQPHSNVQPSIAAYFIMYIPG